MLASRFFTKQIKNRWCTLKEMRSWTQIKLPVAVLIAERGWERSGKGIWLHKYPPVKSTLKKVNNLVRNQRMWLRYAPPMPTKNLLVRTKICNQPKSDKKVKTSRKVRASTVMPRLCTNTQIHKQIWMFITSLKITILHTLLSQRSHYTFTANIHLLLMMIASREISASSEF